MLTDFFQWLTQGVTLLTLVAAVYWFSTWKAKVDRHIQQGNED